ncbi:CBD9-like protein [Neurospora tetrasperma FGSC 2509]|nr:CBD9-like protein [Neurospora tetrasperma FGSC 2509]
MCDALHSTKSSADEPPPKTCSGDRGILILMNEQNSVASIAVHATTPKYCATGADNVCFRFGIPQSSADSGSGNIYFQIQAPSTYSWVALGTGDQMKGSNMFVMYQDGSGNLTLSSRLGTGHSMPEEDTSSSAAALGLLAGSGVANGVMVANVVCPNCETWNGGSLSLTDTASKWIAAWKSGSSLATTSKSASISQHDDHDQFQLDLTQATVSSDSNPFLEADVEEPGTGSGGGSNGGGGSDDPGDGVGPGNPFAPVVGGRRRDAALVAHSGIMTATFAALYPLGSMLMPLAGSWIAHAVWQTVAFAMMWIGFGLGIHVAQERNMPVLGIMHHKYFVKYRERGAVSYAHIWWGRILLTLAVVNGGLGLKLTDASNSAVIAYCIVAAVCFGIYAIVKSWAVIRRGRQGGPHFRKSDNFTHQQRYPVGRQPYRPRNRV